MVVRVEILIPADLASRGRKMLEALAAAAPGCGLRAVVNRAGYRGDCDVLLTYGTGHPVRRPWWQAHRRRGGRCIGLDLGYWGQQEGAAGFYMRATLDDDHPTQFIQPEPPERWEAAGIALREDFDPAGPIVLVGMGIKAAKLHAGGRLRWEQAKLWDLQRRYPGRRVIFRPKRYDGPFLRSVPLAPAGPIENCIRGASLVVCRHSNAAVDACIAGVPVECEDGAARALYGRGSAPTRVERLEFLRSLAWWNWKPEEARPAWNYLKSRLSG
jgi:hypothetical protein